MKLLKTFALCLIAFFTVALTSCNNSFCDDIDKNNIVLSMYEQFNAEGGNEAKIWDSFAEKSKKAYYEVEVSSIDLEKHDVEFFKIEANQTPRYKKALEIYENEHPKACLTLKGTKDPITGAEIHQKNWGFAFGHYGGFIEGLLVYPIAALLIWLAGLIKVDGVAQLLSLIIGTFIIRTVVVLATFKQTIAAQKIQLLTPEMNALNAKYDGMNDEASRNKKAMEMMNLYKKYNINPLTSMIGPFLTLPIFISMYGAVQASTILREGTLAGLSLGQTLSSGILSWNWLAIVLFLLMILTQFLSMKVPNWIAAKKTRNHGPRTKSQQETTQSIMTYVMLFMIVFVGWMLPVSMTIYWVASSVFSILQAILMQNVTAKPKHPKKEEPKSILDQIRG